jgi:hypothetical protein
LVAPGEASASNTAPIAALLMIANVFLRMKCTLWFGARHLRRPIRHDLRPLCSQNHIASTAPEASGPSQVMIALGRSTRYWPLGQYLCSIRRLHGELIAKVNGGLSQK